MGTKFQIIGNYENNSLLKFIRIIEKTIFNYFISTTEKFPSLLIEQDFSIRMEILLRKYMANYVLNLYRTGGFSKKVLIIIKSVGSVVNFNQNMSNIPLQIFIIS